MPAAFAFAPNPIRPIPSIQIFFGSVGNIVLGWSAFGAWRSNIALYSFAYLSNSSLIASLPLDQTDSFKIKGLPFMRIT